MKSEKKQVKKKASSKKITEKKQRKKTTKKTKIISSENKKKVNQAHTAEYHSQAEFFNTITHAVGLGLSIAGFAVLLYFCFIKPDIYMILGCAIYGTSMILLYSSSAFYHGIIDHRKKLLLKRLDHIAIFIFIAGTYTPFLVRWFRDTTGQVMALAVWTVAVSGAIMKLMNLKVKKSVSALPYIIMGWMIVIIIKPSLERVPAECLYLFLGGGIAYTAGVFFYVKHHHYNHAIWHLFVLAGSLLHYWAILGYSF